MLLSMTYLNPPLFVRLRVGVSHPCIAGDSDVDLVDIDVIAKKRGEFRERVYRLPRPKRNIYGTLDEHRKRIDLVNDDEGISSVYHPDAHHSFGHSSDSRDHPRLGPFNAIED